MSLLSLIPANDDSQQHHVFVPTFPGPRFTPAGTRRCPLVGRDFLEPVVVEQDSSMPSRTVKVSKILHVGVQAPAPGPTA